MKTAMDHIGEYRAATTDKERAKILLATKYRPQWYELYCYAASMDADVLSPERLVTWCRWVDDDLNPNFLDDRPSDLSAWSIYIDDTHLCCQDDIRISKPRDRWQLDIMERYQPEWDRLAAEQGSVPIDIIAKAIELKKRYIRGDVATVERVKFIRQIKNLSHGNNPGELVRWLNEIDPEWRNLELWNEAIHGIQVMRSILNVVRGALKNGMHTASFVEDIVTLEAIMTRGESKMRKTDVKTEFTTYAIEDSISFFVAQALAPQGAR